MRIEFLSAVSSFRRVDVLAMPKPLSCVSLTLPCVSLNANMSKVTPSGLSLIEDMLDVELNELVLIDVVELLVVVDELGLLEVLDELLEELLLVLDIVDELVLLEETSLLLTEVDGFLLEELTTGSLQPVTVKANKTSAPKKLLFFICLASQRNHFSPFAFY